MSTFLEQLHKYKDNRGMMASLRCILVENKKYRAWPALNRLGLDINNDVSAYIAGLFATHPEETDKGNFGDTCKRIEAKRGDKGEGGKLTPTEKRFQQLLTAERGKELNSRVVRMVLMAKAQGIPINYAQLEKDLNYWNDRTKNEWATAFWTPGVTPANEEEGI